MDLEIMYKIIDYLLDIHEYTTSRQLTQKYSINKKNIIEIIKQLPTIIEPYGMILESKKGKGYRILITNENQLSLYEHDKIRKLKNPNLPNNKERVNYIILKFIQQIDYVKIDDLVEELFVSRTTLKSLMKDVKKELKKYDLFINSVPHYGSILTGSEFKIRMYFCKISNLPQTIQILSKIINKEDLLYFIKEFKKLVLLYEFDLSDNCFFQIVNYIFITVIRNHLKHGLSTCPIKKIKIDVISQQCFDYFNQYDTNFTKYEYYQLSLLISSMKNHKIETQYFDNYTIDHLAKTIINEINKTYALKIEHNSDLYKGLVQHLIPLEMRIMLDYSLENPIKEQIKQDNPLANEMGQLTARIIEQHYQCQLSDDEISYLTLHFALTLLKIQEKQMTKIILICPESKGIQQIVKYKLLKSLQLEEFQIKISSFYSLNTLNLKDYKCIISTQRIPFQICFPTVKIDYEIKDYQINKIKEYL